MHDIDRINSFVALGKKMLSTDEDWQEAKHLASIKNGWFTPEFIDRASNSIATEFLQEQKLIDWKNKYTLQVGEPKTIGIVMAGNIPMVGFHDLLCVLTSGNKAMVKLSSKDEVLMKYVVQFLYQHNEEWKKYIGISELLKGCDAYIATGSNSTALYFKQYFGKYPNIIRKNRTSVAILSGQETDEELKALADDMHLYFGLGCRNVTKLFVPKGFDWEKLIKACEGYSYIGDHHKYKNNYDYNLALYMLNHQYYMTNGATIFVENESVFSPISTVHYQEYNDIEEVKNTLKGNDDLQCIVGNGFEPFGEAQQPCITQYADGVDVMQWLTTL
jgi:hypothetical protein